MSKTISLGIVSDIHYASAAEQARGQDYEYRTLPNPLLRLLTRLYRHNIWLRDPFAHNQLLARFLAQTEGMEYLVANGDYSCNSAFVGISDDAARESVRECLGKLRQRFGARLFVTYGDHDLGKMSFVGRRGGMPLASWHRAQQEMGPPFWQVALGRYVLIGIVSSLVALPIFESDTARAERQEWQKLRTDHIARIRRAFGALKPDQRVLLFCHDPTALPFLWQEPVVRVKLPQVEQTIIGHLHTNLVWGLSRRLAGMPTIHFLGHNVKKLSRALKQARHWRQFRVRLCPSLAGIELSKGGGYYTVELDPDIGEPARFKFHRMSRLGE
jgi:hypothetical protein